VIVANVTQIIAPEIIPKRAVPMVGGLCERRAPSRSESAMPRTLALNPLSRWPAIPAAWRAGIARNLLGVAVTILVLCAIGLADGRADEVVERATPGQDECGHDRPVDASVAAIAATHHRALPTTRDEKRAERVPVWKTIVLGVPDGIGAIRAALGAHCRVGGLARAILDAPAFITDRVPTPVDLVVLSAAEMGLEGESVARAAIDRQAAQLGLALCPPDVGPQLRLQYPDQPAREFLQIAMHPVVTRQGEQAAFIVGNGGDGLLLIGSDARRERPVPARQRFVFIRPR